MCVECNRACDVINNVDVNAGGKRQMIWQQKDNAAHHGSAERVICGLFPSAAVVSSPISPPG